MWRKKKRVAGGGRGEIQRGKDGIWVNLEEKGSELFGSQKKEKDQV